VEDVRECRDPKDGKYLALAAASKADVIIGNDARHLRLMHPWPGLRPVCGRLICEIGQPSTCLLQALHMQDVSRTAPVDRTHEHSLLSRPASRVAVASVTAE
jgi:hypothetical protein